MESFAGQFRRKTAFEHDERDTEIVFGLTQSVFYSRQFLSAGFDENAAGAILKFRIRPGQVDHEVIVGMTETNHRCCGEHVEDHFLRGPGLEARGTGQDFGADVWSDGDFCSANKGGIAIGGYTDGEGAFLFGVGDGRENVRSGAAGSEADEGVLFGEVDFSQIAPGLRTIVFSAFDREVDGLGSAGNEGADEFWRNTEGGRTLGSIEDAEAAAGAGPDIEEASTAADVVDDAVDGTGDGGKFAGDGESDAAVFAIHDADDFERRHVVQIAGSEIALLGAAAFARRGFFR